MEKLAPGVRKVPVNFRWFTTPRSTIEMRFSNRSKMTSKCGNSKKVAHEPLDGRAAGVLTTFWRLLYNAEVKKLKVTSFMRLSSNRSQLATNQSERRI